MRIQLTVLAVLAPLLAFAVPGPTIADSTGVSVTGINGVLYDTCRNQSWSYSIDPSHYAEDWAIFVTAYDHRGVEQASTSLWKDVDVPASGTVDGSDGLFFCGGEPAGTYTLTSEIHYYSGDYPDATLPEAHFTMRKPKTRTAVKVSDITPSRGQRIKFTESSKGEFPKGYFGLSYPNIRFQRMTTSGWKTMAKVLGGDNGVAHWTVNWRFGKAQVRALTVARSPYTSSSSTPVRIR